MSQAGKDKARCAGEAGLGNNPLGQSNWEEGEPKKRPLSSQYPSSVSGTAAQGAEHGHQGTLFGVPILGVGRGRVVGAVPGAEAMAGMESCSCP